MEKVVCDSVCIERMWIKDLVRDLRRRKIYVQSTMTVITWLMATEDLDSVEIAIVVGVLVAEDIERES